MVRAPATTIAPSAMSARVTARPIPLLAPVTTQTLVFEFEVHPLPSSFPDHHRTRGRLLDGSHRTFLNAASRALASCVVHQHSQRTGFKAELWILQDVGPAEEVAELFP